MGDRGDLSREMSAESPLFHHEDEVSPPKYSAGSPVGLRDDASVAPDGSRLRWDPFNNSGNDRDRSREMEFEVTMCFNDSIYSFY